MTKCVNSAQVGSGAAVGPKKSCDTVSWSKIPVCHDSLSKHLTMSLAVMETEVLSDEQIDSLLQAAEERLRAKAGALATNKPADESSLTLDEEQTDPIKRRPIPRLQTGIGLKSYICDDRGVAQIAPQRLAHHQQQNSAIDLRSVDYKQSKKDVRSPAAAFDFKAFP
jgi:hypothetical protein